MYPINSPTTAATIPTIELMSISMANHLPINKYNTAEPPNHMHAAMFD
jgi:hypothetical protein